MSFSPLTHNKIKFSLLHFWDSFAHSTIHPSALFDKLTQGTCRSEQFPDFEILFFTVLKIDYSSHQMNLLTSN